MYKIHTYTQENKVNQRGQAANRMSGTGRKSLARIHKSPYEDLRVNFRTQHSLQMLLKRSDVRVDKDRTQGNSSTYYSNANAFCDASDNQEVIQGVFKRYLFTRDVYLRRGMEILKEVGFLSAETTLDKFRNDIYGEGNRRNEMNWQVYTNKFMQDEIKYKRQLAKWDILMNLLDHFDTESGMTEEESAGADGIQEELNEEGKKTIYLHYQMYDELPEEENTVIDSHQLLSAIDCKILNDGTLWIESFVSFKRGMGKQLLKELLLYEFTESMKVALGAYPGTESYYEGLGFEKKEDSYVSEKGKFYGKNSAMENFRSISQMEGIKEDEAMQYLLNELIIYPVYVAPRSEILKRL